MNERGLRPPINRLLKIAVANGVESAVKVHIARGDDLNAYDEAGNTPLMIAAKKNRANVCKLLLENGADALLLNDNGKTAFTIASEANASEAAEVILTFLPPPVLILDPQNSVTSDTQAQAVDSSAKLSQCSR